MTQSFDLATSRSGVNLLVNGSRRGLAAMYLPDTRQFVQTARGRPGSAGPHLEGEGTSERYTAIVALGLSRAGADAQEDVLSEDSLPTLVEALVRRTADSTDAGAVALAAWAAAEAGEHHASAQLVRLEQLMSAGMPLPTVQVAWALSAAVAAAPYGPTERLHDRARALLLRHVATSGLFPHLIPTTAQSRWRSHVACFADQIYPIQALARASAAGDSQALSAANRCAALICDLQGPDGQWWWHYDIHAGDVVDGYPVYSVHQHGMAPAGLMDLSDAGGRDSAAAIRLGVRWLDTHPEVLEPMVEPRLGVIWRKVGRREPRKAARLINAASTSLRAGTHVPLLDRALPAVVVDHECRPYELGWLLYAWGGERLDAVSDLPAPEA